MTKETIDPRAWLDAHWEGAVVELWRSTVKLFRGVSRAEDAFQEVYLSLLEGTRTIMPGLRPFLVVRNALGTLYSNEVLGGRARFEAALKPSREARAPASAPAPDVLLAMKTRAERIEALVAADPIARAIVASVRDGEDIDFSEVGDDKAIENATRRLRYAIEGVDEEEREEERAG